MSEPIKSSISFFNKNRIIGVLIFTNLCAILLLLNIHRNISNVKKTRAHTIITPDSLRYDQNPAYIEQTALFEEYPAGQAAIVMMGSSFTQRVNWNELLQRCDVVNRGIGSDVSEGYLHRVQQISRLQPRICFLELGANDIMRGIALDTVKENTRKLIRILSDTNTLVVLSKCFLATEAFPGYVKYNLKADSLNKAFDKLQHEFHQHLVMIDINPQISDRHRLPSFALSDGIHLNAKAIGIWKREIEKVLLQKRIPLE